MSSDLSSFYLDITKDVLYCNSQKSLRRLQVQNVIYQVTDTLMRLLTPFLPFTMDEIYHSLSYANKDNVQLLDYPSASHQFDESVIKDYQALMELRDIVLKKLEEARSSGLIGSPRSSCLARRK
jgi:isoleucyl-tRNA synthetase